MNSSLHNLSELAFKYLKGELDAVETEELNAYLAASPDNRLFFEKLTSSDNLNANLEAVYAVDSNAMWKDIVAATPKLQKGRIFILRNSLKYAAAVILIAALVAYLFISRNKKAEVATVAPHSTLGQNDIPPGGNRAILTLSGGKRIVLESVNKGSLAMQGKTAIVKTADGQLTYDAQGPVTDVYYNTVSTPKGGQYQLKLSDGSNVWMNAASVLHFPTAFTGKERLVELDGEAYFEVAKNANMPFIVRSKNGMIVKVTGTQFNMMCYSEENDTRTTLIEGAVIVSNGSSEARLKPGQQALSVTGNINTPVRINTDADVEEAIAWKNGVFQFNNADLKTVMRQVARWYDVEVSYDDRIPEKRFTGRVSRNLKASELLSGIEYVGVHFKIDGKKILVLP